LHLVEEAVQKRTSFIISPEGTRTLTGEMGQFKKGAFHVAKNTGITIVPVGIQGAFDAKNKNDWRLTPGILTLHFGELIKKEEYNNMTVEQLRDFTRNKISELIQSN
jgi:1-acyl-sn-glycerol-3-phosphate acyltransferase